MEKILHEVAILVKNESAGVIGLANNYVANYKPDAYPRTLIKDFPDSSSAKKEYLAALQVSESHWWRIIYRGVPLYG